MPLKDFAQQRVVTVDPGATARRVAELFREKNVGSVVVTDDAEPVGIITDRDVALQITATGENPDGVLAEEIMSDDLFTMDEDTKVHNALDEICKKGVRRIPLVKDGYLSGIVTVNDLVASIARDLSNISGVIHQGSPGEDDLKS